VIEDVIEDGQVLIATRSSAGRLLMLLTHLHSKQPEGEPL
jgi:hypothetical protein